MTQPGSVAFVIAETVRCVFFGHYCIFSGTHTARRIAVPAAAAMTQPGGVAFAIAETVRYVFFGHYCIFSGIDKFFFIKIVGFMKK
jgi:hypothetical protein